VAGRLTGRLDYAAGFIFMRRMGSAALTATGPVLNVLPLAVNIDPQESLPELALRLANQLKKCAAISATTPSRSCATAGVRQAMKPCLARC
jgi:enterobactin synthetase component F